MRSITTAGALLLAVASPVPGDPRSEAALKPRVLVASRVRGEAPAIDGRLDEPAWRDADVATDFVQQRPEPGPLATLRTEGRVLFDSQSLYVGIRAFDPEPDTILAPWPRRDDETTSDWLFVEIDSRHDRRTAFSLGVNPRGVQVDGTFIRDNVFDNAWDAVWESAARVDAEGWTAEFRIPFSQLAYATETSTGSPEEGVESIWGLNIYRHNPRRGQTSNWSPRLPSLAGVVSNFNELHLRVPAHPRRLELLPYLSLSMKRVPGENALAEDEGPSGGVDVKAGLGSAFVLSAALHPDFSQVEADPSEVNLTTFETFFGEHRPLFVESAGLFRFESGLPFTTRGNSFAADETIYSRRIGRAPRLSLPDGARYGRTPEASALIGAAKLTGRTSGGWSIGSLYAATGAAVGEYVDDAGAPGAIPLEPRAHFAAARVSRDFRRGGSAFGGFVTLVARPAMAASSSAILPASAEAAGIDGRHRFAADTYELTGFLVGSRISGTTAAIASILHGSGHFLQRPDAPHLRGSASPTTASGFGSELRLAKVGGEHWRFMLAAHALSPRLELNDLGFQRNSDWLVALGALTYQQERPGRWFRRWALGSSQIGWGWSFGGERRAALINANFSFDLNNYWGGNVSFDREFSALDTEALRGGGALLVPPRSSVAMSVYSDQRRQSQWGFEARAYRDHATAGRGFSLSPFVTVRTTDRLSFTLAPGFDRKVNPWQFVAPGPAHPVVAELDQTSMSLTTRMDLAFSSSLTLQVYAQPFASRGLLRDYRAVVSPRAERVDDRFLPLTAGLHPGYDTGFATTDLRMNVLLRWEYRPGSRLYVVWSQARHDSMPVDSVRFPGDALAAFDAAPANLLLVKLNYWVAN